MIYGRLWIPLNLTFRRHVLISDTRHLFLGVHNGSEEMCGRTTLEFDKLSPQLLFHISSPPRQRTGFSPLVECGSDLWHTSPLLFRSRCVHNFDNIIGRGTWTSSGS